ncbi:MAG: hypothetical protein KGM24_12255, partial [Elusimicrobia bacterium]|nr:hypothetical protein [Elusimicrobiota bacterium]
KPPPALLGLPARRPATGPRGRPTPSAPADLAALQALDLRALPRDRRRKPHWDASDWHDGPARGLPRGKSWLWVYQDGRRWWALAGDPAAPALNRSGAWWVRRQGVWLLVHDGALWAWRTFSDWRASGLFQPGTGVEMVYSRDLARVAIVTPGRGARVYDARTGAELARIPPERMPRRRRPSAPAALDPSW